MNDMLKIKRNLFKKDLIEAIWARDVKVNPETAVFDFWILVKMQGTEEPYKITYKSKEERNSDFEKIYKL